MDNFEAALRRLVDEYRGRMPDLEIVAALRDEIESIEDCEDKEK